ncbi:MAG: acyl-ACP--UDP-N-acetylglucosamine O-acyltransferase [Neomegalonema sp.]|nr:acyl-ACP--UDP-N-acetylglucosamine O-acyltransferase [Neomegalonema sp.]
MMAAQAEIHPTAIVDPEAQIAPGARIGPYCVIGAHASVAAGVELMSHVVVEGRTSIGEGCKVFPFASLGSVPQDLKYAGEPTRLEIGARNTIREHVTMNLGTEGGGGVTRVGEGGLYMVGVHVGHDCQVGDGVILANNATLAGHVEVQDHAVLGGLCAVHQFTRIGAHAMVGGMSGVEKDVIPFGSVIGNRAELGGLNLVGMKRRGFDREAMHAVRRAYDMLFFGEGVLSERVALVREAFSAVPAVMMIVDFIEGDSARSFCTPRASGS